MNREKPTSFKQLFQGYIHENSGVFEGTVTRASPLEITLVNDAKMIIDDNSLVLPRHLTDYTTTADITQDGGGQMLDVTIKIKNALTVGEMVYLLQFNEKQYFILDRKEE